MQHMSRMPDDPIARSIALSLLARGIASPGELAEFAGVSRQVVENWARRALVDWRRVKRAKLAKAWRRAMANVSQLERRRSARQRVKKRVARARQRSDAELAKADKSLADNP
jgi:hypothetical protein